ncbi:MAG: hypothetical protein ACE37N_12790 [Pseudohongiellaceae bacterium]
MRSNAERAVLSTGTGGDLDGGEIVIAAAGDLSLRGQFDISSDALGDGSRHFGGDITLAPPQLEQAGGADNASTISSFTASAGSGATVLLATEDDGKR